MEEMPSGAVRSSMFSETVDSKFSPRYDLLPFEGLRRWAEAFGEGSRKYGDDNFRMGMEDRCLLQHALNHLFLYQAGDNSEDHLGHAMWNIGMLCKMEKERPELMVLQRQIAMEYDGRERPIYAKDDPRLSQPMGMADTCNVASSQVFEAEESHFCRHCGSARRFHDPRTGACQPQDQPKGVQEAPMVSYDEARRLLEKAYTTFMRYGEIHEKKGTLEAHVKAIANYELAKEFAAALGK